ncbi:MAG TPA: histidinol-phosphatase HisJ family protein [Candidatus Dormibacteraeota bacterium]|nr:histidinol-phosphatase HisJ family protein [Candidatus Dormibacteraeota bacterium]
MLLTDNHVHTEWSYDAPRGHMEDSCRRALELGLPAIAFTDHADFVKVHPDQYCVDINGYLEAVERCRAKFPDLRILSGVELGEPHWFPKETAEILAAGALERVHGSVHCVRLDGVLVDASDFRRQEASFDILGATREYFREVLAMVEAGQPFETLAHLDYPKRYWPAGAPAAYREQDFEDEMRAILRAAAQSGRVLEVNTTRGNVLCPGHLVLRWWRDVGGQAVSFGSDAHDPDKIAVGFEAARQMVESLGFKPAKDPTDYWRR